MQIRKMPVSKAAQAAAPSFAKARKDYLKSQEKIAERPIDKDPRNAKSLDKDDHSGKTQNNCSGFDSNA